MKLKSVWRMEPPLMPVSYTHLVGVALVLLHQQHRLGLVVQFRADVPACVLVALVLVQYRVDVANSAMASRVLERTFLSRCSIVTSLRFIRACNGRFR